MQNRSHHSISYHRALFLLLLLLCSPAWGQTLRDTLSCYFASYSRSDQYIGKCNLDACVVDTLNRCITVSVGGAFKEQFFTEDVVGGITRDVMNRIPDSLRHYQLQILSGGHPLNYYIPNFFRSDDRDEARMYNESMHGGVWVRNISSPIKAGKGLDGAHIAVWQSHGRYMKNEKNDWYWQRPRLFCTTEDLFTQTFVVPYIIPMLENAGACVYTPRERDWQYREVIVDNDSPGKDGLYLELIQDEDSLSRWAWSSGSGFAHLKDVYCAVDTPFCDGSARRVPAVRSRHSQSFAQWVPDIPEEGWYAVYVTYPYDADNVNDAVYAVHHKGVITKFRVNQTMGYGTWVYLGSFLFGKGMSSDNMVVLSNDSKQDGCISADAVRFGGGMGNIAVGGSLSDVSVSGLPRWAEGARYYTQWAGMPQSVFDCYNGTDDYKSDINARSYAVNHLTGGSVFMPDDVGRNVPFELSMAFHSDAGFSREDSLIGSLAICTTNAGNGKTAAGLDRMVSRDLCNVVLANLSTDLRHYGWRVRQIWDKNYSESREPQVPCMILEMLSHQNFADMCLAYDPQFRFDFSRSVYKSVVKYLSSLHDRAYVIQPLPVRDFAVRLDEDRKTAYLSWVAVADSLEPSANAKEYIVYTRVDDGDFDNGRVVKGTSCSVRMKPGYIYSFRVCAQNDGGCSFPSEILSAYVSPHPGKGTALIVNGFTRLEGPAQINNDSIQGFDLESDPGVQYGRFAGFCGVQKVFTKSTMGSESSTGLGFSGSELEGKVIAGNSFDYPYMHGDGMRLCDSLSFTSCSEGALLSDRLQLSDYVVVDVIYGVQKVFSQATLQKLNDYCRQGGRLLISGANLCKDSMVVGDSIIRNTVLPASWNDTLSVCADSLIMYGDRGFEISRSLGDALYCVPAPAVLVPDDSAAVIMTYHGAMPAAVCRCREDGGVTVFAGFPLETITDRVCRREIILSLINMLLKE